MVSDVEPSLILFTQKEREGGRNCVHCVFGMYTHVGRCVLNSLSYAIIYILVSS